MKILSKKKLRKKAGVFGRAAPIRKVRGGAQIKKAENPLDKVNLIGHVTGHQFVCIFRFTVKLLS